MKKYLVLAGLAVALVVAPRLASAGPDGFDYVCTADSAFFGSNAADSISVVPVRHKTLLPWSASVSPLNPALSIIARKLGNYYANNYLIRPSFVAIDIERPAWVTATGGNTAPTAQVRLRLYNSRNEDPFQQSANVIHSDTISVPVSTLNPHWEAWVNCDSAVVFHVKQAAADTVYWKLTFLSNRKAP